MMDKKALSPSYLDMILPLINIYAFDDSDSFLVQKQQGEEFVFS